MKKSLKHCKSGVCPTCGESDKLEKWDIINGKNIPVIGRKCDECKVWYSEKELAKCWRQNK